MSCLNCHIESSYYPFKNPSLCKKCWNLNKYCQQCKLYFNSKKTFSPDEVCGNCIKNDQCCRGRCNKLNSPLYPKQYPVYCTQCSEKYLKLCLNCGRNGDQAKLKFDTNLCLLLCDKCENPNSEPSAEQNTEIKFFNIKDRCIGIGSNTNTPQNEPNYYYDITLPVYWMFFY